MVEINYEQLVSELIKPLTTHPEDVKVTDNSLNEIIPTIEGNYDFNGSACNDRKSSEMP